MNSYSLPNVKTLAGTFKITLFTNVAVTVPSVNTFLEVGDLEETVDELPLTTNVPTLRITLRDDYSTYSDGFWFNLLVSQGDAIELKFMLDEGDGDTFYFWGRLDRRTIRFSEYKLFDSNGDGVPDVFGRTLEIELTSLLVKLKEVTIEDLIAKVQSHKIEASVPALLFPFNTANGFFCRFIDLYASAIECAFGQSYSAGDVIPKGQEKIQYGYNNGSSTTWLDFTDLAFVIGYNNSGYTPYGYLDPAQDYYWGKLYKSAWEIISRVNANFGHIARHIYDTRHSFELLRRPDDVEVSAVFNRREEESDLTPESGTKIGQALVARPRTGEQWGYPASKSDKADAVLSIDFGAYRNTSGAGASFNYEAIVGEVGSSWQRLTETRHRKNAISPWVESSLGRSDESISQYLYERFQNQKLYERQYDSIKEDTYHSHLGVYPMRRTTIFGVSYYATRVVKNASENRLSVSWAEV